jgi:N-glycosylase/DNA lyase
MHRRTKDQCFQRYTYSLRESLKKGAFSESEDFIVMIGVRIFGESSWTKIADFLPQRTPQQIYARYTNFLKVSLLVF